MKTESSQAHLLMVIIGQHPQHPRNLLPFKGRWRFNIYHQETYLTLRERERERESETVREMIP